MRFLFLTIIFFYSLFAVEVDKTWFDNPKKEDLEKLYLEQSKKIDLNKKNLTPEEREQLEYQQLLLKKLTNLIKENNVFDYKQIDKIESLTEYIEKIKKYIEINQFLAQKNSDLENDKNKLQALEEQINNYTVKDDIITTNAQLLYAYYTLSINNNKDYLDTASKFIQKYKEKLLQELGNHNYVIGTTFQDRLNKTIKDYEDSIADEKKASLALDKALISTNEKKIKLLSDELEKTKKQKIQDIEDVVYTKLEPIIITLQNKKSKYFDEFKDLQNFIGKSGENYSTFIDLFKYLSREHIGLTKTTFADTKESFIDILKYSWDEINRPIIPIGDGVSILAVIKFILIFIVGFTLATFYRKKITNANASYLKNTSIATRTILANLGYYFLVAITFVFGLKSVGIDLSSLTILVGALSVGIGFGLQNIVSNFISGIILIFEKSIQVGNIIEIGTGLRGKVTQINMRSSVITTFDNIEIIIPNSTLMQNNVINLTFSDDVRRLHVPFGVAYGSNIESVIEIILSSLEESNLIYIRNVKEKKPIVRMIAMAASSVDFELLVWINENPNENGVGSSTLSDFLIFIYNTLLANNIEIPFPQMDLHIKKEKLC